MEIAAFKALEAKSMCIELFYTKRFILQLPKPDSPRSAEKTKKRRVIAWSTMFEVGDVGPVKPVHMVVSDNKSSLSEFC